jgi:hypothetical protein
MDQTEDYASCEEYNGYHPDGTPDGEFDEVFPHG